MAAVKDGNEGLYELVLRDENGAVSGVTRPGAIRLNMAFGDARLLFKGWTQDLSALHTDRLATVVLPRLIATNDVLRVGVKTVAAASYFWLQKTGNGTVTKLPTQTGPRLSFKDVIRLKGDYVLSISTAGASRRLTFQVLSFATTSGTATGLVAPVGGAADFAVGASGSIGGYRWWKRVAGVDTELVAAGSSPWLTLDKAAFTDEGSYYVEVLPAALGGASVQSTPVLLDVVPLGE